MLPRLSMPRGRICGDRCTNVIRVIWTICDECVENILEDLPQKGDSAARVQGTKPNGIPWRRIISSLGRCSLNVLTTNICTILRNSTIYGEKWTIFFAFLQQIKSNIIWRVQSRWKQRFFIHTFLSLLCRRWKHAVWGDRIAELPEWQKICNWCETMQ